MASSRGLTLVLVAGALLGQASSACAPDVPDAGRCVGAVPSFNECCLKSPKKLRSTHDDGTTCTASCVSVNMSTSINQTSVDKFCSSCSPANSSGNSSGNSSAKSSAKSSASVSLTSGAVCAADEMDLCSDIPGGCAADEMDLCSDEMGLSVAQMCAADEMDLCSDVMLTVAKVFSQLQWESSIHMFEDQPMISQKITKDFLRSITVTGLHLLNNNNASNSTNGSSANGSASHRLLAGAANATTNNTNGSSANGSASFMVDINYFDKHIAQLELGDAANNIISAADMGPLVQTSLQAMKAEWLIFKALIILDTGKAVPASDVHDAAVESESLLKRCQDVMAKMIIMESASGAHVEEVVVTIARRQTMLMQEMLVEVLLISHGIDVAHSIHVLHEIEITINGANKGIILGAPWAGVPILSKFCTLNEMTKVTTKWGVVKPFVDEIIGSSDPQQAAMKNVAQAITSGDDLEHEMEVAVALYMSGDDSCDIAGQIPTADWKYLLNSVDLQRYYGQRLALQVLQVANNISIQASKVDLTINMARTFASLRVLIEGNYKHSSPPTQKVADLLIASLKVWNEISREFEVVIFADVVDVIMVSKVIRLAAELLHDMDLVMGAYMEVVSVADKEVPAYLITTAGHQRTYLQEMALEASEIKFYADHDLQEELLHTLDVLNLTRDHFLESHWALLQGNPANNVAEMTNLCVIKKMKEVKDQFDELKTAAWKVVAGDKQQIAEMMLILPIAHELMDTATDYYSNGVETCTEVEPTLEEWQAGILQAGQVRTSSQKTCTQYLWDKEGVPGLNPGDVKADFWGADGTIGEGMVLAITKLRFGWGADNIPAPYNDKMREDIAHVTSVVTNFSWDLKHDSAEDVVFDSNAMLKESQILVADYLEQAQAAFPSMPVNRIEMATRLAYLVNRMLKEALLIREHAVDPRKLASTGSATTSMNQNASTSLNHNYTIVISQMDLARTMSEYGAVVSMLKDGAPGLGVPKVITQRADIENQQARVAAAFAVFSQDILCVADDYCKDTLKMKQSLDDLETEIHAATLLYYVNDPIVEESYPWTVVIYVVVAVLVVAVVGFGCWRGLREAKIM